MTGLKQLLGLVPQYPQCSCMAQRGNTACAIFPPLTRLRVVKEWLLVFDTLKHNYPGLYFNLSCRQRIIHCAFLQRSIRTGKRHSELLLAIAQWWDRFTDLLPSLWSSYPWAVRAGPRQEHHSVIWVSLLSWILHKAEKLPLLSWKEGWFRTFWWENLYNRSHLTLERFSIEYWK